MPIDVYEIKHYDVCEIGAVNECWRCSAKGRYMLRMPDGYSIVLCGTHLNMALHRSQKGELEELIEEAKKKEATPQLGEG